MNREPNQVSTESQRLALEAMSAQLVHKLNTMIREQEERARKFAEQHHSTLPTPQQHFSYISQTEATPPPRQETPASRMPQVPPLPTAPKPSVDTLRERLQPRPAVRKPAQKEQPEESNIGMGMVIFALVGIMILIRSCT